MYNLNYFNEITGYLNELNELLDNNPNNEELQDNFNNWLEELEKQINCIKKACN